MRVDHQEFVTRLFPREVESEEHAAEAQPTSDSDSSPDHKAPSPEWLTIQKCLKRIRKWRVPPHWSKRDWLDETTAEVMSAVLHASRDYDASRGVPRCAYLYRRIMYCMLSRYRREWTFAIYRSLEAVVDDYVAVESADYPSREVISLLLRDALAQLPSSDASLIEGLFWEGKTESSVAESLGISQQAVNKRKRTIFNLLQRIIEANFT